MTGHWVSPVVNFHEWNLTRNGWTLRSYVWSLRSSASGHNLNVLMTVEIGRSAFEVGATRHASHHRTLGSSIRSI